YEESGLDASFWSDGYPTAGALLLAMDEQSGRHWVMSDDRKTVHCETVWGIECQCSIHVSAKGKGWHLIRFKRPGVKGPSNCHAENCVTQCGIDLHSQRLSLFYPMQEREALKQYDSQTPLAALSSTEVLVVADARGFSKQFLTISVPSDFDGSVPCFSQNETKNVHFSTFSIKGMGSDKWSFLRLEMDTYETSVVPWRQSAGHPMPEGDVSCVSLDDRILCMWRVSEGDANSLVLLVYTPATGAWAWPPVPTQLSKRLSKCPPRKNMRVYPLMAVVRGAVHVIPGNMKYPIPHWTIAPKSGDGDKLVWHHLGWLPVAVSGEEGVSPLTTIGGKLLTKCMPKRELRGVYGCSHCHAYTPETGEWVPWKYSDPFTFPGVSVSPTVSVQVTARLCEDRSLFGSLSMKEELTMCRVAPESLYPHESLRWAEPFILRGMEHQGYGDTDTLILMTSVLYQDLKMLRKLKRKEKI
ncbi:hypothetical protein KIPB_003944, partial [Kipferlia bialata]